MCCQSGSLKKTALKDKADLDAVVFMNDFRDMDHFMKEIPRVLEKLEKMVKDSAILAEVETRTRHALKIKLRTKVGGSYLDVDILPAFNNVRATGKFYNIYTVSQKTSPTFSTVT